MIPSQDAKGYLKVLAIGFDNLTIEESQTMLTPYVHLSTEED